MLAYHPTAGVEYGKGDEGRLQTHRVLHHEPLKVKRQVRERRDLDGRTLERTTQMNQKKEKRREEATHDRTMYTDTRMYARTYIHTVMANV